MLRQVRVDQPPQDYGVFDRLAANARHH